jgi:hypothetical protein
VLPPLEIPALATNEAVQATSPAAAKSMSIEPLVTQQPQTTHGSTNTTTDVPQSLISEPLYSIPDASTNELSMQSLVKFFKQGQGGTNQIDTGVFSRSTSFRRVLSRLLRARPHTVVLNLTTRLLTNEDDQYHPNARVCCPVWVNDSSSRRQLSLGLGTTPTIWRLSRMPHRCSHGQTGSS